MINNHRYYRRNGLAKFDGYYPLRIGDIKRTIAYNQTEMIYRFKSLLIERHHTTDESYHQSTPYSPIQEITLDGLKNYFVFKITNIQKEYGDKETLNFSTQ
ncbi:MAG: hypothetical protein ACRCZW_03025 [Lactobacillaceae bacterium]